MIYFNCLVFRWDYGHIRVMSSLVQQLVCIKYFSLEHAHHSFVQWCLCTLRSLLLLVATDARTFFYYLTMCFNFTWTLARFSLVTRLWRCVSTSYMLIELVRASCGNLWTLLLKLMLVAECPWESNVIFLLWIYSSTYVVILWIIWYYKCVSP